LPTAPGAEAGASDRISSAGGTPAVAVRVIGIKVVPTPRPNRASGPILARMGSGATADLDPGKTSRRIVDLIFDGIRAR
jgi:hypothetical protein